MEFPIDAGYGVLAVVRHLPRGLVQEGVAAIAEPDETVELAGLAPAARHNLPCKIAQWVQSKKDNEAARG